MANLLNLAIMTVSSAPGTGATIGLSAAATINGTLFLTFAQAGAVNGTVLDYSILDTGASEIGTATYSTTGPSLTGRTPTSSTNSNAAINASAGALIYISPRTQTLPKLDIPNTFTSTNSFPSGALNVTINSNLGSAVTLKGLAGGGPSLGVFTSDSPTPSGAGISYVRSGVYAVQAGLDVNNSFIIGGWSDGAGVSRWEVAPGGDGFYARSLGIGVAASGTAGDVKAKTTTKAWVNFVGSTGAINSNFNVSSVTRNAAGDYTVNFTASIGSTTYAICGSANANTAANAQAVVNLYATSAAGAGISKTTTACRILVATASTGAPADFGDVSVMFFGV